MSQPPSQASWPAGIPEIRLHPTDLEREELPDEARGWLLFVREEVQPTSNPTDALHQRRSLIEKWATASQEFRESYYQRAPVYTSALDYPAPALSHLTPRPDKRFLCLPPVDRETHGKNYIHLVKFLIFMYILQDDWVNLHPFDAAGAGQAKNSQIPQFLDLDLDLDHTPDSHTNAPRKRTRTRTKKLNEVLPALYLTNADFGAISMTRSGNVIFPSALGYSWFIIEEDGLETGRLTIAEFGSNANVRVSTLRRPWNMAMTMSFLQILGRFLCEIVESCVGGPPQFNEPLDMDRPIIELLETTRLTNKFLCEGYGSREIWVRTIERCAPGYLELEAQGKEIEFELGDLLVSW